MIDTMLRGLASLVGGSVGLLLLIVAGFALLSRGRVDLGPFLAFLGQLLFHLIHAVFYVCGLVAEAITRGVKPAYRTGTRQLVQTALTAMLIGSVLYITGGSAERQYHPSAQYSR